MHDNIIRLITTMLQEGLTAVYKASQKGHSKIIQLLLKAGAHVDEPNDVSTFYWNE